MKTIKVIFAGINPDGEPDLAFCKIKITEDYLDNASHDDYDKLIPILDKLAAKELDFESKLTYFETDACFLVIEPLFIWETASEFDLTHLKSKQDRKQKQTIRQIKS